ncbi:hypothetical protein TNCV_1349991 [Trichonephila clavipes]|nr:hypothetical protein TNCV_1349991 [Trichonephila clavipes]
MAQHRPRKSAPIECTTEDQDMIVYDVEEEEIESNPDYVFNQNWLLANNPKTHSLTQEADAWKIHPGPNPPIDFVWKFGEGAEQVSSSALNCGSKLLDPTPIALVLLQSMM